MTRAQWSLVAVAAFGVQRLASSGKKTDEAESKLMKDKPTAATSEPRRLEMPPAPAATEQLAQRIRDGQGPKVKVYDKTAPSQRPVAVPTPEMQRSRERAAPAPTR